MENWEELNMEVRAYVISRVLKLEQSTSDLLIYMLRMFNPKSKTLGNQSSAMPFKTKVDMLFDLYELDKTMYNHLIKLMEIRNQFAHNHNAISFQSLDDTNPDINKYLLKNCPEKCKDEVDQEVKLKKIFDYIYRMARVHLHRTIEEYKVGIEQQAKRYFSNIVVENMDVIWRNALVEYNDFKSQYPPMLGHSNEEKEIDIFKTFFEPSLISFRISEMGKMETDIMKIYSLKDPMLCIMEESESINDIQEKIMDTETY